MEFTPDRKRMLRHAIALIALAAIASSTGAQILSVPPATMPARGAAAGAAEKAASALLLPTTTPARAIGLAAPAPTESAMQKRDSATSGTKDAIARKARLAIGYPRTLAEPDRTIALAGLPWLPVGDHLQAARIAITSPTAAALRVGFSIADAPAGLVVRYQGSSLDAATFGPEPATSGIAGEPQWSPVLDGNTALLEFAMPRGPIADSATLAIPMISHLSVSGIMLKQSDPLSRIGRAGGCEVDVVCATGALMTQSATATNAVARMVVTIYGTTYLCTGSLLNDGTSSNTPYFYTANHCFENEPADYVSSRGAPAAAASTVNTYWFFQTSTCGVHTAASVNFVQLTGGATLLARSVDFDWLLLRLRQAPPGGTTFAAWNATVASPGTAMIGIHHPSGDLKKLSQGSVQSYVTFSDNSSFIEAVWSQGVTEGGSSGSGLFVLNAAGGYYELRGGLFGGGSDCSSPKAPDYYSRLDVAQPLLASYLTPNSPNPTKSAPIVEFYNQTLDDYFLTIEPGEIGDLDNGVHPGWVRTGFRFLGYTDPAFAPVAVSPVCRFYVAPAFGDSHFYSASPAECAATAQKFAAQWIYESPAVFYIILPDTTTGACPGDSRPIYRFLNNANGLHHRYTAEVDVRDATIGSLSWTLEGYGNPPDQVVMCTPLS